MIEKDGLVVVMSDSHVVSCGFAPLLGYTKDHHKNVTNCLPAWHTGIRVGVWQCIKLKCVKKPSSVWN